MFSRQSKCHHSCWEGWGTVSMWQWWLSQENYLHVQPFFSISVRHWGSWGTLPNYAHPSFGAGAWPESWTPTHRDAFIHSDENHCVGHMHTFSSPSGLPILWGPHLFSPCVSHLWAVLNAEKVPARQRSASTQIFLRACGNMVLVLSKLSPWKHRVVSEAVRLQGSPGYLLQFLELVGSGLAGQLVPIATLKKEHKHQCVLG